MAKFKLIISSLLILGTILSVSLFTVPTKKAQAYTITPNHPRLLLTPEKITRLRELKDRVNPDGTKVTAEWNKVFTQAGGTIGEDMPTNRAIATSAALVYKIVGDPTNIYIPKVKQVMNYDAAYTDMTGNDYRNAGYFLPLMYDWIYEKLTDAEKVKYYTVMNGWSKILLSGTPTDCRGSDTDQLLGDSRALIFAAIATYNDNSNVDSLITLAEDSCRLGNTKRWYKNTVGGLWPPGSDYSRGELQYAISFLAPAYKTGMNRDYWQEVGYPNFGKEQLTAFIYDVTPSGNILPYGDIEGGSALTSDIGLGEYDSAIVGLTESLSGTPEGEYAQYIFKHMLGRYSSYYYLHFLFYDPDRPEKNYKTVPNFATDYLAKGMAFGFSRTDWTNTSSYIASQSQWAGGLADHHHSDAGNFQIMRKGVWLLREDSGYDQDTLVGWPTINHNTFLINSENANLASTPFATVNGNQTESGSGKFSGGIAKFEANSNYTYMASDFSGAYQRGGPTDGYCEKCSDTKPYFVRVAPGSTYFYYRPMKEAVRNIVHLKPDYFVIFDRLESYDAFSKQSLLHSDNQATINGNLITSISSHTFPDKTTMTQKLFTQILLPENAKITQYDEHNLTTIQKFWQTRIKPPTLQNRDLFLTVMQGADETTASMVPTARIDDTTDSNSVGVQVADRVVMFSKTAQFDDSITYSLANGTGISKQLITGLRSTFPYTININGNSKTMTSSDQGTLAFDVTLGTSNNISIIAQNVPLIHIAKSADKPSAKSGDILTYTLNYSNTGTVGATNAKIEDPIPVGTTFDSIVSGGAVYDSASKKIYLNIGNLGPAATGTIQFKVKVN